MADNVQWIRLKVGMFDGNSFKKIKRAKIGGVSYRDKLTAVWFELMDLAGKCNSNGFLVENNEIAYSTFEDIATMLDRDEKEIELCMQFYINERMVEIIDDIYCLTNFLEYQNREGLEKIREQKRIRQAKWRERKALGLVDEKASTRASTERLPSYSISNSISNSISTIFNYWNGKQIIVHRDITDKIKDAICKALKQYSEEDIILCIERYATIVNDKQYFWHYKWSLTDFLSRKDGISSFTDEGSKWCSYQAFLKRPNPKGQELCDNSFGDVDEFFKEALERSERCYDNK